MYKGKTVYCVQISLAEMSATDLYKIAKSVNQDSLPSLIWDLFGKKIGENLKIPG